MWKLFFLLSKICIILRFFNLCISTYHKHLLRGEGPLIKPNYLFFSDQIDRPFKIQLNINCILFYVFSVCFNYMSFYIWHFLNEPQSACVNKWSLLHRWGCPPWRNLFSFSCAQYSSAQYHKIKKKIVEQEDLVGRI